MISENRDPAFWEAVASHPAVAPHMGGKFSWEFVRSGQVQPFAATSGGFLFVQLDVLARTFDLHAAMRPEGWGKPAAAMLKEALTVLPGWQIITASEVAGNWRSRPPKSFGFRPAGESQDGLRTWILTRDAWERSPVRRRME